MSEAKPSNLEKPVKLTEREFVKALKISFMFAQGNTSFQTAILEYVSKSCKLPSFPKFTGKEIEFFEDKANLLFSRMIYFHRPTPDFYRKVQFLRRMVTLFHRELAGSSKFNQKSVKPEKAMVAGMHTKVTNDGERLANILDYIFTLGGYEESLMLRKLKEGEKIGKLINNLMTDDYSFYDTRVLDIASPEGEQVVGAGRPGKSRVEPPGGVDPGDFRVNKYHSHFVWYVLRHMPLRVDRDEDVKGLFQRFIDTLANSDALRDLINGNGANYNQTLFENLVEKYNQWHYNDMVDLDELRK